MNYKFVTCHLSLVTCHWRRRRPGLSLVELMVGIAILGIVGLMVAAIYIAHFRLFSNQNTQIEVSSQNRIALDEVINQVREGFSVVNTCCSPVQTTSTSKLVLQLWPLDESTGDPYDPGATATAFDYVIYSQDATNNFVKQTYKCNPCGAQGSKRTNLTKKLAANLSPSPSPTPDGIVFTYKNSAGATLSSPNYPDTVEVTVKIKNTLQNYDKKQTFTQQQEAKARLRNK